MKDEYSIECEKCGAYNISPVRCEKCWRKVVILVHMLDSRNYYYCNRAVGNGVRGIATKNKKLVTCKNCINLL